MVTRSLNPGQIIVGEVEEELNAGPPLGRYYTRNSGLYLLPEAVPNDGNVAEMRAYGILNYEVYIKNQIDQFDISMYLFFVVFRLDDDSGSYQLVHGPEMATHTIGEPTLASGLAWPVRRGDRIGAVIPNGCFNDVTSPPFPCPSQINFRVPQNDCSAALYSPTTLSRDMNLSSSIPANQFVEEQVMLNIEAVIEQSPGMSEAPPIP